MTVTNTLCNKYWLSKIAWTEGMEDYGYLQMNILQFFHIKDLRYICTYSSAVDNRMLMVKSSVLAPSLYALYVFCNSFVCLLNNCMVDSTRNA